ALTLLGGARAASGQALEVVHAFAASMPDAAFPEAALIQVGDGTFYGTSSGGGAYGQGTVFKVTADGLVTVLHSFQQTMASPCDGDGAAPQAPLVWGNGGSLYGTTNNPSNST